MPPPRAPDEVVSLAADGVVQVSAVAVTSPAPLTLGAALELKVTLDSSLPRDLLLVQGGGCGLGGLELYKTEIVYFAGNDIMHLTGNYIFSLELYYTFCWELCI